MKTPRVKFKNIPIALEVDWIHGFLFKNKRGWGKWVIRKHPSLKDVFFIKGEKKQVKFIRNYILNFRKKHKKEIERNRKKYQIIWRKIEKKYFVLLGEILDTKWPKNKNTITAMISINPICPWILNTWSFFLFFNYKKTSDVLEVIMHETCHFLYFKEWKELYLRADKKTFEAPHIEWHLSEIIAPIVLNDERIQGYLGRKAVFYPEHSKIKIQGKTAPQFFTQLYKHNIKDGNGFEKFLITAYREIKKYRKLFAAY